MPALLSKDTAWGDDMASPQEAATELHLLCRFVGWFGDELFQFIAHWEVQVQAFRWDGLLEPLVINLVDFT